AAGGDPRRDGAVERRASLAAARLELADQAVVVGIDDAAVAVTEYRALDRGAALCLAEGPVDRRLLRAGETATQVVGLPQHVLDRHEGDDLGILPRRRDLVLPDRALQRGAQDDPDDEHR